MGLISGAKVKMAKSLCHPAIGRLLSVVFSDRIPSRGFIIDTHNALITPEVKALLFWRLYESAEIRFVKRYLRRDLDVIELGSSLGVVSCQIRERLKDSSRLLCVEANPELADQVSLNLCINSLNERVLILKQAIDYDSTEREAAFFDFGESNIAGKIVHRQIKGRSLNVKTTTLSRIVDENGVGNYVLVSDIEGAEAGIALHEKEALKNCKQIIMELHPTTFNNVEVEVEQICNAFIDRHGFTLRDRCGPVCVFEKS